MTLRFVPLPCDRLTMKEVIAETADRHGLSYRDLIGNGLARRVTEPRQEAMWRARCVTMPCGRPRWSLPQIAAAFKRDHSTVLHGVRAHAKRVGAHV